MELRYNRPEFIESYPTALLHPLSTMEAFETYVSMSALQRWAQWRIILSIVFLITCSLCTSFSIGAQTLSVQADSIMMWADTLPEFKTGPWATESQGNQLSGVVRRMLEDKQGNYWWGTQSGLVRYDHDKLIYFDLRDINDQRIVLKDILEDENGDLWFTQDEGLTHYNGKTFDTYTTADGLIDNDAWGLCRDSAGDLWIGTMSGACRYDGSTFHPIDLPASSRHPAPSGIHGPRFVRGFMEDCQQRMWLVQDGGVYVQDGGQYDRISVMEEDSPTYVSRIVEDRNGHLWFSTMTKGIIHYDGERFMNASEILGTPESEGSISLEDSNGHLWFSMENDGVYRFDGKKTRVFSAEDGMTSGAVHQVLEDSGGRIWFVGWSGVFRYDPSQEGTTGKSVVNVTRDGPW